jgi:transcriptional regulator with XRE-family HTH domain
VVYTDGNDRQTHHILFSDIRPMQPTPREHAPKIGKPLLSAADIDRINAEAEAKAKAPPPPEPAQTLVRLVRTSEPPPSQPRELAAPSDRRKRKPRPHTPTPLSEALRRARLDKGLQQREVARLAKITRLSDIEFGDIAPTDEELLNLAIVLDADFDTWQALRDKPPETSATNAPPILSVANTPTATSASRVEQLEHELAQLRNENAQLRAAHVDATQVHEDNVTLRRAVVFYAGLER